MIIITLEPTKLVYKLCLTTNKCLIWKCCRKYHQYIRYWFQYYNIMHGSRVITMFSDHKNNQLEDHLINHTRWPKCKTFMTHLFIDTTTVHLMNRTKGKNIDNRIRYKGSISLFCRVYTGCTLNICRWSVLAHIWIRQNLCLVCFNKKCRTRV